MARWRVLSRTNHLSATRPIDLLLLTQAEARARAVSERAKPDVLLVSVHLCPHAEGEPASEWYNCKNDPRARYEEN